MQYFYRSSTLLRWKDLKIPIKKKVELIYKRVSAAAANKSHSQPQWIR